LRYRSVGALDQVDQLERVFDLLIEAADAVERFEQIEPELAAQLRQRRDGQVLAYGQAIEKLVDLVAVGEAESVWADDAAQLAVIDGKIDVTVGGDAAVVLGEALGLQDRPGLAVGFAAARRHGGDCRLDGENRGGGLPLALSCHVDDRRIGNGLGFSPRAGEEAIEILNAADQSTAQETDQQHEDDAEH